MGPMSDGPRPKLVCALCGAAARLADDGFYRHAKQPFEDQSTFCDRYGYPIPVRDQDTSGAC